MTLVPLPSCASRENAQAAHPSPYHVITTSPRFRTAYRYYTQSAHPIPSNTPFQLSSETYLNKPNVLRLLPERLTAHVESVLANDTRLFLVASNNTGSH